MNNFFNDHRDQLTNYLIVFGMGGFVIYAALIVTSFTIKYGMQIMAVFRSLGL